MSDDQVLGVVQYGIEQGLIIIEDADSRYAHDDWDPSVDFVSAGPDSIYLSVQPAVDGPIELIISNGEFNTQGAGHVYFDGMLRTAGSYAVIRDASDVMRFSVRRPRGENHIRIVVDEPGFVSKMYIMFLSALS